MSLPPGPALPPTAQTLLWIRRPIDTMLQCRRRFGDPFTLRLKALGTVVMVSDPAAIKQIFTGDPRQLHAGEANRVLEPLVGQHSVLLLDGAEHLRHRRLVLPPFHGERMRLYGATMQAVTEDAIARFPVGEPFSLHPWAQQITLEVILRTVFGVDEGRDRDALRSALRRLLAIADRPMAAFTMLPALRRDLGPWTPWARFVRDRARADDLIYREITRRRAAGALDAHSDVLSLLLAAVDDDGRPLGDVELRDELMTLLVAGHETTATALCWAVERILGEPGVYPRVRDELDAVLAGGVLEPDRASKLAYLDAAIKEALRVRPVIPLVGRRLQSPLELAGYTLPPGVVVAPCIYLAHLRAESYPEPTCFRPERFLGARPDPYAWFPFGGGPRRCIGMAFALYELRIVLAALFANLDLELAQRAPAATVRRAITFTPEYGTRLRAQRRAARTAA